MSIVFSPDGDELAFATPDFVSIWELSRPEHRFSFAARRRGSIWLAQYSPQGTLLATANGANDVRSRTFRRKKGSSNSSKENEIRLWDAATGHERGNLSGHRGPVRALDFSADGKRLASGSADKTVKIWDVAKFEEPIVAASVRQVSSTELDTSGRAPVSASSATDSDDEEANDAFVVLEGGVTVSRSPSNRPRNGSSRYEPERPRSTWFDYRGFKGGGGGFGGGGFSGGGGKESGDRRK